MMQFASHVEIHWPDGTIQNWSSVRVLRVKTVVRVEDGTKEGKLQPAEYITLTLVEPNE
jgi:hypothetical protein